ncbi:hypothetical protein [Bradyrhizobium sp. URHD0069]|uniref:hypothetical protein n=1 Tax=Bradyrhizobium sp. URHD0069 TaxID=1380355 RepID=UPI00068E3353|nr:hypothetical protein [Bradyrhizobium sp. URHD0069]
MHSTLKPKQTDDPHDVLEVASDAVVAAPGDELTNVLRDAARHLSDPQTHTGSGFSAGPPVPPVVTTFRPAVNNVQVPGHRRSIGRRALRAFTALLLAACIGVAAIAWQSHGEAAKAIIAKWAPQLVQTSSRPLENPGLAERATPPAVQATAAKAAPPQPAPLAQTVPEGVVATAVAPSPESAQLLQSMARDLATVGQQIEQLKASIEQLKASQEQMSRDVAKVSEQNKASEQNLRPRTAAPPPRSAAAPARRPMPPYPPTQAASPSVPRQVEPQPQAADQPQAEPESSSVPRPPMPVR